MNGLCIKNKIIYKIFILLFIILLCFIKVNKTFADVGEKLSEKYGRIIEYEEEELEYNNLEYYFVSREYPNSTCDQTYIEIDACSYSNASSDNIEISNNYNQTERSCIIWNEDIEWIEWEFDVPKDNAYEIFVEYCSVDEGIGHIKRGIAIDSVIPFKEAYSINLYRFFTDIGKPVINNLGDEVPSRQKEVLDIMCIPLEDKEGSYIDPYLFYMEKGTHSLRFTYVQAPVAIFRIIIKTKEEIPSYSDVIKKYKEENYINANKDQTITIQAEEPGSIKNSITLKMDYESNPDVSPFSYNNKLINVINNFDEGGLSISWEFNVPEDGLYNIGMNVLQDEEYPVYRKIMIDGKVPFEELSNYAIKEMEEWDLVMLGEDEPYLFYLEKGKHTITIKSHLGKLEEILINLYKQDLKIIDILSKVYVLTGDVIDEYNDYNLEEDIPGIFDDLQYIADEITKWSEELNKLCIKKCSLSDTILICRDMIMKALDNKDFFAKYINTVKLGENALSSVINNIKKTNLIIDEIIIGSPDNEWEYKKASIWQKIYLSIKNFIKSFTTDYDGVAGYIDENNEERKVVTIWSAIGRERTEMLKELSDKSFSTENNIIVDINLVPGGALNISAQSPVLLALAAGKAPDIGIGLAPNQPVEFAIRDGVYDLSRLDGFEEIKKLSNERFYDKLEYNNGIFGLPMTFDIKMLFYRTDLVRKFNLIIPDTWEELCIDLLPELYKNNMKFSFPNDYNIFLYQNGGQVYTDDGYRSALDTKIAYDAFVEWIEYYKSYGMPVVQESFYSKIRTGEIPVGISGIQLYLRLISAAPELEGKWDIAVFPGTYDEDTGEINRSVPALLATTCVLFKNNSGNVEEGWEFLKWWMSYDTQVEFGYLNEATLGIQSRWISANYDAFRSLEWNKEHIKIFDIIYNNAVEVPVVLGGYFTGRHIANAWTRIITDNMNIRESFNMAIEDINNELIRKQKEYGINTGY